MESKEAFLEYEKAFLQHYKGLREKSVRYTNILALTLNPAFAFLDYYVAGPNFIHLLPTRSLPTLFALIYFIYKASPIKSDFLINFLGTIPLYLVSIHIAVVITYTGGTSSPYVVGLVMMLFLSSFYIYCGKIETVILACSVPVLYIISTLLSPAFDLPAFMTYTSVLSTLGVMTYFFLLRRYRLEKENFISKKRIEDKNKALEKLDEAKTRFFTNLTHEFRTPLVAASTLIQMIREKTPLNPELSQLLQSSTITLEQMLENVNDLLTQTKSEQASVEIRWTQIDIVDLANRALSVFKPLAEKQKVHIALDNQLRAADGGTAESFLVYADHSKLKQALNNLLGNAIKFTQQGTITIRLNHDSKHLILNIEDTGIGIPAEELDAIFEPFTQASNNSLRDVKGTGLGLSIVKDFITAQQGNILVESKLGQGTTFTIFLLLGDDHVDKKKMDPPDRSEEGLPAAQPRLVLDKEEEINLSSFLEKNPEKANVLIVEDNIYVLQSLACVLQGYYNLHFARNGEAGWSEIQVLAPNLHLVISDIMMPKLSGYELLARLKKHPELKKIPFILLTAKNDMESKIDGLELGADEYLSKPFNAIEVRTRIQNLLDRKKLEAEFVHAEKMIALGLITAGISHEILNPIAYAKNAVANIPELLQAIEDGHLTIEAGKRHLAASIFSAQDGIRRVCEIANAIQGFVRLDGIGFQFRNLHEGLDATLKILTSDEQVRIHRDYRLQAEVFCNLNQLNQVFLNLFINATQAIKSKRDGDIWINTWQEADQAYISIQDNGPGIPEELLSKIFNPFFTTKDVGQGTGLGLYIAQQIVQGHAGGLSVENAELGTKFIIRIPLRGTGDRDEGYSFYNHIDQKVAALRYPDYKE